MSPYWKALCRHAHELRAEGVPEYEVLERASQRLREERQREKQQAQRPPLRLVWSNPLDCGQ